MNELDDYELEIISFKIQFPELNQYFDSKEIDFMSAFYSNHSYLPVFYILTKYFSRTNDKRMRLYAKAYGIAGKTLSCEDIAKEDKLSVGGVRGILNKKEFEKDSVFCRVKPYAVPENYKILKHSIIRNIETDADHLADKEDFDLTPVQLCGVLRLLGYTEIDDKVSGNIMVRDDKFGSKFQKDWKKTVQISQLKCFYPTKHDIGELFDLRVSVLPDTIEYSDLQKVLKARLNATLEGETVEFPINEYNILKFAKRLSEDKQLPIAVDTLMTEMNKYYPREYCISHSEVCEVLNENSGISFFKIGNSCFYKSRMLRKFNVGVITFFEYWTNVSQNPVSINRIFDRVFVEPEVLMETMDLYVPKYFQFFSDENGDIFVGRQSKDYDKKYTVIFAKHIVFTERKRGE